MDDDGFSYSSGGSNQEGVGGLTDPPVETRRVSCLLLLYTGIEMLSIMGSQEAEL